MPDTEEFIEMRLRLPQPPPGCVLAGVAPIYRDAETGEKMSEKAFAIFYLRAVWLVTVNPVALPSATDLIALVSEHGYDISDATAYDALSIVRKQLRKAA